MRLSDDELEALLADIESDRAERKESFKGDAPEKVRQAVCAFANDLPGHRKPGVAFIGVKDNGTPAGLACSKRRHAPQLRGYECSGESDLVH